MSLRWDPSKVFPGLAEGIADGSIPFKIDLCTDPSCEQHWPAAMTGHVYMTLHSHADTTTPPQVSSGYPRRNITWTSGEAITTTWTPQIHPLGDEDDE